MSTASKSASRDMNEVNTIRNHTLTSRGGLRFELTISFRGSPTNLEAGAPSMLVRQSRCADLVRFRFGGCILAVGSASSPTDLPTRKPRCLMTMQHGNDGLAYCRLLLKMTSKAFQRLRTFSFPSLNPQVAITILQNNQTIWISPILLCRANGLRPLKLWKIRGGLTGYRGTAPVLPKVRYTYPTPVGIP
jgi:hypothetical protein